MKIAESHPVPPLTARQRLALVGIFVAGVVCMTAAGFVSGPLLAGATGATLGGLLYAAERFHARNRAWVAPAVGVVEPAAPAEKTLAEPAAASDEELLAVATATGVRRIGVHSVEAVANMHEDTCALPVVEATP